MKNFYFKVIFAVFFFLSFPLVYATNYYVATTGSDSNNGTSSATAFLTLAKAVSAAKSGDVINVASGTYTTGTTITMSTSGVTIKGVFSSPTARPLFDFSSMAVGSSNFGIHLKANNCYVYGIIIKGAGDNGFQIDGGNDNKVEFCDFLENQDSGVQLKAGAMRNLFINCDSYYNVDPAQGNADGFANKLDEGGSNKFIGCRAWQNSDDGWDGLPKDQTYTPRDTIINCWCYKNGYLKDGSASSGNGNGFKLGGNSLIHQQVVMNCLSTQNRAKGFDYNNNLGTMIIYNCTAYGNGGIGNFAFPNAVASGEQLVLKNCLSYNTAYGNINSSAVQTTNSWMSPFSVSSADFVSTDPTQMLLPRKSDGSLPDITFMHLATGSDLIDGGTNIGLPYNGSKPDLGCFETGTTTANVAPTVSLTAPTNNSTFCQGTTITLTATAADSDGSISKVDFYDGATLITTVTTSPYTYSWTTATAATHSITAKATDNGGASTTSTAASITVNAKPSATITAAGATTFCQGGSVVLNANTGTGLTYVWKNGTTTIANATASSYTANTAGSYTVTVTSNGCSATSTATTVTVTAPPTATITAASATTFCQGGSVVLNANTGTGLTYVWKNGTTTIANATASSYTANTAGSYTVTVTSNGCSATSTATTITVNALPTATITAAGATTFCQGGSVVLNTNTGTGLTYVWKNGTTTIANATASSYTANAAGSYTVTVTSNSCSTTSSATTVTVTALPTATITAASATTFCQGGSVVLNANTGTGLTYVWKNGTTTIANSTASSYTANAAGSYTVTVTSNGCSATSTATTVTVTAPPTATITAASATTFCQGGSVVLNANTGTGLTYVWKNGTTTIVNATASSYTANAAGSYTVTVTANSCSATSTATTVAVTALPTATITAAGATTFCQGGSVVLNANTSTGLTYVWKNGTTTIANATASSYTANAAGSYTVTVTSNGCLATSTATTVTVTAPPTTSSAGNDQYITSLSTNLAGNTPTNGSGTWTVVSGTGAFANANSSTSAVTGLSMGDNTFKWTITNGVCPSSSAQITIHVSTAPVSQTINGPVNVASNSQNKSYSIPGSANSTYNWTVPTGATIVSGQGTNSIVVNFGTTGGAVSVTETNSFGTATSNATVNVGPAPVTQTITGDVNVASGEAGVTYSVPNNPNSTYNWTVPTGATIVSGQGTNNIVVDFGSTSGAVALTESNPFGNATSLANVTVGNAPSTSTISGPDSVGFNTKNVVYSIPGNGSSSYNWTVPAGATIVSGQGTNSIEVDFGNSGGTGAVSVTETNAFGNTTSSTGITAGAAPGGESISGPDAGEAGQTYTYSVPALSKTSYNWTIPTGGTIISGQGTNTIIVSYTQSTSGDVAVTETNGFGSGSSVLPMQIAAATGIFSTSASSTNIQAYPNPFSEDVNVVFNTPSTMNITLRVLDMKGEIIFESSTYKTNETITLGSKLTSGIYMVLAIYENEVRTVKVEKH